MIKIKNLENDLRTMKQSKSWKITAPLRKMKTIYNKFIKKITGA